MASKAATGVRLTAMLKLLADGRCITLDELEAKLGGTMSRRGIGEAATRLVNRAYLIRQHQGCYQLTEAGIEAARAGKALKSGPPVDYALTRPPTNGFRDRAWRSMRIRRQFTIGDVVSDAVIGEVRAEVDLAVYLRALKSVGYVAELRGRTPGVKNGSNGFKRFRLIKDTGPRAPLHRAKLNVLHDYNTGEDFPCIR